MAAPHVTGLAALLLAHHPVFQGPLRQRNVQRVANLYNALRPSGLLARAHLVAKASFSLIHRNTPRACTRVRVLVLRAHARTRAYWSRRAWSASVRSA